MSGRAGDGRHQREVTDLARSVASSWAARAAGASAQHKAAAAALLVSDADRDRAVQRLTEAFTQGRLLSDELDERTGRALAARTRGELDVTLDGLGGLDYPVGRRPASIVVLWLATILLSPFVLFSVLFLLFGSDLGDRVFGAVLLALAGTPLYCVWRWSRG